MTITFAPSYLVWVALIYAVALCLRMFFIAVDQQRFTLHSYLWKEKEREGLKVAYKLYAQLFFLAGLLAQYLYVRFLT